MYNEFDKTIQLILPHYIAVSNTTQYIGYMFVIDDVTYSVEGVATSTANPEANVKDVDLLLKKVS